MKQQYTFSRILSFLPVLLVAFLWLGGSSVFASGGTFNLPSTISTSGGGVFCETAGGTTTLTATVTNSPCGGGGPSNTPLTVQWYDASGPTLVYTQAPQPNSGTTTFTYDAPISAAGSTDYYCVITWADPDGGGSCSSGSVSSSGSPESVVVQPPGGVACIPYCTFDFTDCNDEYISDVTLDGASIAGALGLSCPASYGSNIGTCIDVSPGNTYNLCVDVVMSGGWTNHMFAYFDWDQDGVFEVNEDMTQLTGSGSLCIPISVPPGATPGSSVMRIIISETANPAADGCSGGSATYGDVEDFCINVLACTTTAPLAGPDQLLTSCTTNTSLAGNTITQGTGTWSLVSGTGVITDPSNPTTTVTGLGQGANTFVWTVEDAPCPTLTDTVIITTQDTPTPAAAGSDQDGCVGATYTLDGNAVGVGETGEWSCTGGACGSVSFTDINDPTTTVTLAGAAGTTATLTWTIDNGVCADADNMVLTVITGVTAANAGGDQTECIDVPITLAGNTPTDGQGTWSTGVGVVFEDATNPTTEATGITSGTYTLTWTISAAGCAPSSDDMTFTVDPCDPTTVELTCGSPETYTDGAGNYPGNSFHKMTYCSTDPSNPYVTVTFSEFALFGTTTDYLTIIDGDGEGDPFIYSSTTDGAPGTITSSNPDGCLTLIFMSDGSNSAAGYTASIDCSAAAGSNTAVCNDSDCQGGCGRTICGDGQYEWAGDGISAPELNTANNGCLGLDEQCNVWYYINPASVPPGGGDLSLQIASNGGQDQDFAVWEGYNSTLDCPVVSGDEPIACNFVSMSASGTGFDSNYADNAHEPSLWITEDDIANGIYFMVLINTYNSGGACPQTTVDLTFGGTALLSCEPLGVMIKDINGVPYDDYNFIYWETLNEYNCESFTLERSKNMVDWEDVGTVPGAGTSDRSLYYSMKDYNREQPITYYRLKEKDFDGVVTYSKVISVSTLGDEKSWITDLFPNPANESFSFQYNGNNQEEALEVYVYDMLGRQVVSQEFMLKKHDANVVNTQHLENGQYRAVFVQGEKSITQSFTILR